jgi:hypothetical protein
MQSCRPGVLSSSALVSLSLLAVALSSTVLVSPARACSRVVPPTASPATVSDEALLAAVVPGAKLEGERMRAPTAIDVEGPVVSACSGLRVRATWSDPAAPGTAGDVVLLSRAAMPGGRLALWIMTSRTPGTPAEDPARGILAVVKVGGGRVTVKSLGSWSGAADLAAAGKPSLRVEILGRRPVLVERTAELGADPARHVEERIWRERGQRLVLAGSYRVKTVQNPVARRFWARRQAAVPTYGDTLMLDESVELELMVAVEGADGVAPRSTGRVERHHRERHFVLRNDEVVELRPVPEIPTPP